MATSIFDDGQSYTPGRDLRVLLDPDDIVLVGPFEEIPRTGHEIARGTVAGAGTSTNMTCRDGLWGLTPLGLDGSHLSEQTIADTAKLRLSDFNVADHVTEIPIARANDDLPGMSLGPDARAAGDYFIIKVREAGVSVADSLTGDIGTIPQPPLASNNAPMDRVAVAKVSDKENSSYTLRLLVPGFGGNVPDHLCTFYFGGIQSVSPPSGLFCATFDGSGLGTLFAYSLISYDWFTVQGFQFAPPNEVSGREHTIIFEPKGRDTIGIRVPSSGAAQTHGRPVSAGPGFGSLPPDPSAARYTANAFVGLSPTPTITGAGEVRMDVRRDLMVAWQITRGVWPDTGQLIDHPAIFKTKASGYVYLRMFHRPYANGTIAPQLYHDNDPGTLTAGTLMTGASTGPSSLWRWDVSGLDTRSFGVVYNFTSDTLGTPYLRKAVLFKPAATIASTGLKQTFTPNEASATGFDGDPARVTGSFAWEDLTAQGDLLRQRGRLPAKIQIGYIEKIEARTGGLGGSEDVLVSNLIDGEIADCPATLKGVPSEPYPAPNWHRFEGSMVGKWARAADQFNFNRQEYFDSELVDPTTNETLPPFITEIIRSIFSQTLGVPDAQLDIPDVPIRLLPSEPGYGDYQLQPKQNPLEYVRKLCEEFLGYTIWRDDNAGTIASDFGAVGMWRLKPRTSPFVAGTPLASFVFGPDNPGKPPHWPSAYPAGTYPAWAGSYSGRIEAPACNFVLVIAADNSTNLPNDAGQFKGFAALPNPLSYNFDPDNPTATDRTHPDFLDRFVPLVVIDYTLGAVRPEDGGAQGACWALAYALMDLLGHGRKWVTWKGPLALITDPNDPYQARRRCLTYDDRILFNGFPAILRSCHAIGPLRTDFQDGLYQAVLLNGRWSGGNWVVDPNGKPPM